MEYLDEKIVNLKKQMRNLESSNIKLEGIYIGDSYFEFQSTSILDSINIFLPIDFIEMPDAIKNIKYQSISRPEIIWTSLSTNINFAFNWLSQIPLCQVKELVVQAKEVIRKMNPAFIFYDEKVETNSLGLTTYMFDYKSYGVDEQIYNMMCFIPMKNGMLQGIFNCLDRDSEDWKDAAWQVFLTAEECNKK